MENLNVRELMIGNYVKQKHPTKYIITAITKEGGWIELTDGFETIDSDIDNIEPIPLTEDILLKCGFVKSTMVEGCFIHNKHERLYVSIINPIAKHFGNKNGVLVMIDYLHTLQNLYFALTNEELTIKL